MNTDPYLTNRTKKGKRKLFKIDHVVVAFVLIAIYLNMSNRRNPSMRMMGLGVKLCNRI